MKKTVSILLSSVLLFAVVISVFAISDSGKSALERLGLNYTKTEYTDKSSNKGTVFSFEYDPTKTDIMPYVFNYNSGWGAQVLASAKGIASKGYNVLGGVNGDFFSMSTASYGVLVGYGMYIGDGRIYQAQVGSSGEVMTFDSNGKASVVLSKLKYDMFINGEKWTVGGSSPLAFINKRSDSWQNGIYLWDSGCGNKTDSVLPGLEIVCEKQDNTEISVGKSCYAKVVDIRKDSYNSEFKENQFVLYIKNGSSYQTKAKTIKVGDMIEIAVEETFPQSKEAMNNANACIDLLFQLIENGNYVGFETIPDYAKERPRTGIGIKKDGSIVILAVDGDGNGVGGSKGMTAESFAKMFKDAGCEYAYNLDGGGSTAVVVNDNGTLVNEYTQGRPVGNALILVERKDKSKIDSTLSSALNKALSSVTDKMKNENVAIKAAYDNAQALLKKNKAMDGDYRNALYALNQAIGAKAKLESLVESTYKLNYKKYTLTAWNIIKEKLADAKKVLANSKSTTSDYNSAYYALLAATANDGDFSMNVSTGKKYTRSKVWDGNYDDPYFTELTDGVYGAVDYGAHWTGFHTSLKESDGYYNVTIDLGEKRMGLSRVNIQFLSDVDASVDIPSEVRVLVSDKATSGFVEVAKTTSLSAKKDSSGVWIRELVDAELKLGNVGGRYVQIKIKPNTANGKVFTFLSEIDVYEEHTLKNDPVTSKDADLDKINSGSAPTEESKPAEESRPAEESKSSSTSKPADESKASSTSKPSTTSEPADESIPADESESSEEGSPADESVPADESEPADESVPADESEGESEPADESIPADTSVPADESKPDESKPEKSGGNNTVWIVVGIVVAVLAVGGAVAAVLLQKKKGVTTPETPDDNAPDTSDDNNTDE